jgi:thymidylate synthase (FAD)
MDMQSSFSATSTTKGNQPRKFFLEDGIGFVELLEWFGSDLTVANAARVSMHKESAFECVSQSDGSINHVLSERDKQLITYLARNRHVTPFFHPQLRFRIKMPIFVVREWYRHTIGFARNEVSRRYVTEAPQCFVPSVVRQRDKNIKQGSKDAAVDNNEIVVEQMRAFTEQACALYNQLLQQGVCPEQARMILPQSMYTEFIETASLAGYARLAILRLDGASQREIRTYASFVAQCTEQIFPISWKALMDTGTHLLM